MDEIAIKVDGVSKDFILPHEKVTSVKSAFTSLARRGGKTKETQHALKNISFEIKKGEFFGIVGRNGSGKSTMLKILAGIYQPTSGKVHTVGKLVPFIELGVGFNPELTGRENVYLNGAMLGFSEKEIAAMYDDIVAFAELENFMDQKLKNYSSGMQVRLAFSMATRSEAEILLIDEVLAVGDADFQRKCFNYFKLLKKNKQTVVFVSHDMEAVKEYCDRAVLIDRSELKFEGNTRHITEEYIKLFRSEDEVVAGDEQNSRWGNGNALVQDIKAKVTNKAITITQTILSKTDDLEYMAGIRIRNAEGHAVTGTNTKLEGVPTEPLKKDRAVTITWSFPNVLCDGTYTIDPALTAPNGVDVYDWWDDARSFTIKKSRRLPYPVDPEFAVEVRNHDK